MVLIAAADGRMTNRKVGTMAGLAQTMPAFRGMDSDELSSATGKAEVLIAGPDGLDTAFAMIRDALASRLRQIARS